MEKYKIVLLSGEQTFIDAHYYTHDEHFVTFMRKPDRNSSGVPVHSERTNATKRIETVSDS